MANKYEPIESRFWRRVGPLAASGCIEWIGAAKTKYGYGVLYREGKQIGAHVYAYERVHGRVPKGTFVLHRCDNPPCVNVEHLFTGDHSVNMQDRAAKGRGAGGVPPGERHPFAKYSDATALAVQAAHAEGEAISVIAKTHRMPYTSAWSIVNTRLAHLRSKGA